MQSFDRQEYRRLCLEPHHAHTQTSATAVLEVNGSSGHGTGRTLNTSAIHGRMYIHSSSVSCSHDRSRLPVQAAVLGLGNSMGQLADRGSQGCPDICEAATPLTVGQSLSCPFRFRTWSRMPTNEHDSNFRIDNLPLEVVVTE